MGQSRIIQGVCGCMGIMEEHMDENLWEYIGVSGVSIRVLR